jgi:gliding motility-associated-like protein
LNKPFYIFLFILLFCCEAKTQTNLVYNGDFEIYDTCPTQASYPTLLEINKCKGWYAPTLGTSDFFNSCSNGIPGPNGNVWIPNNVVGYQNTFNGNGYVGLCAFEDINQCQYREYVQTKLNTPLTSGKSYSIEYYVSLANHQAAVNSISALFTTTKLSTNDNCFIVANPQIKYTAGFITDTLGWTKISGSFIALGGEEYLTLGFFEDTLNHTGVLPLIPDTVSLGYFFVYYYIDGIKLNEILNTNNAIKCNDLIPNIFTPNGDSVNDLLCFKTCSKIIKTTIYNRWGNLVFETDKQNRSWDGRTTSGESCNDGAYFYLIETEEKIFKGFIQLIR